MREAKTVLSEVTVILNTQGNIEVEHHFVPVEDFLKTMNQKLPSYENTHVISAFMQRANALTKDYYDSINKLLT